MKISYNWLKSYLDIAIPAEELAAILTDTGLEVENVEHFSSVKGGFEGIVVGAVLSCERHPDADKLFVCSVNIGDKNPLTIVCGAPNVAKGQKVPVATVGTSLYPKNSSEAFVIKKAKIRGVASAGMICAEDELGIGMSHEGIMVLDPAVPAGTPFAELMNVESDTVFTIGLTPNRTDSMSHIGVARDIIAFLHHRDGKKFPLQWPDVSAFSVKNSDLPVTIDIENREGCGRYTGLTINHVTVKESPGWLKNRLNAIGIKPINNIVDITNFVLHETGHPLHAFDYDSIDGHAIVVKTLPEGTSFTTLDGIERKLSMHDLMICSASKPLCIAGVYGGVKSGVTFSTRRVFLESAWFNPLFIRKTAKYHTLSTDASFRYERGADPEITLYAIKRAALLIEEITGGAVSSDIIDEYPLPFEKKRIVFRFERLNMIAGQPIEKQKVLSILKDLAFEIVAQDEKQLTLLVPAFRVDVTREIDVIEEVLRIFSYNAIDIPRQIAVSFSAQSDEEKINLNDKLADFLSANGYYETWSNSLTNKKYAGLLKEYPESDAVHIHNPLSADLGMMRQTMLFGLLELTAYNNNRQVNDVRVYEMGNVYQKLSDDRTKDVTHRFKETAMLAILISGNNAPESWYTERKPATFFDLKDTFFALLNKCGVILRNVQCIDDKSDMFDVAMGIYYHNRLLGRIGIVKDILVKRFDAMHPCFFGELFLQELTDVVKNRALVAEPLPRFPSVRRDLALVVDKNIKFSRIHDLALKTENQLLKNINLFDVYEGEQLPDDKRSYAVSFTLRDDEKTLTDKKIDKIMKRIVSVLETEIGAKLR